MGISWRVQLLWRGVLVVLGASAARQHVWVQCAYLEVHQKMSNMCVEWSEERSAFALTGPRRSLIA